MYLTCIYLILKQGLASRWGKIFWNPCSVLSQCLKLCFHPLICPKSIFPRYQKPDMHISSTADCVAYLQMVKASCLTSGKMNTCSKVEMKLCLDWLDLDDESRRVTGEAFWFLPPSGSESLKTPSTEMQLLPSPPQIRQRSSRTSDPSTRSQPTCCDKKTGTSELQRSTGVTGGRGHSRWAERCQRPSWRITS